MHSDHFQDTNNRIDVQNKIFISEEEKSETRGKRNTIKPKEGETSGKNSKVGQRENTKQDGKN